MPRRSYLNRDFSASDNLSPAEALEAELYKLVEDFERSVTELIRGYQRRYVDPFLGRHHLFIRGWESHNGIICRKSDESEAEADYWESDAVQIANVTVPLYDCDAIRFMEGK